MGQNTFIHLKEVRKSYTNEQGETVGVLREVNLDVAEGTLMAVVGLNGAGKTTLLRLIAGMEQPDAGTVKITTGGKAPQIGYVWQDYRSSLLPWYDAADNIALPLKAMGVPRKERRQRAVELLREIGEPFAPESKIYNLSGGQQQLIAILRSVVVSPDVMLLDEPLSALDQLRAWEMSLLLEKLWLKKRPPMLFISHDIDDAILIANEILFVSKSRGGVATCIKVDLPRPRSISMLASSVVHEIRAKIFALFEAEKRSTSVPWSGRAV